MENQTAIQSNGHGNDLDQAAAVSVTQFVAHVRAGVESWEAAGQILVQLVNEDKDIFKKITEAHPFITRDSLEIFHRIGTRTLYPLTMLLPRHIINHVRTMRYEAQKKVTTEPVQVVSRIAGDMPVIVRKSIAQLTAEEANRALWQKGNRSVEAQVRELKRPAPSPSPAPAPAQIARQPISKGLYSLRRNLAGQFILERTTARPYNTQRVMVESGQAVIEICQWGNT